MKQRSKEILAGCILMLLVGPAVTWWGVQAMRLGSDTHPRTALYIIILGLFLFLLGFSLCFMMKQEKE